MCDQYRVTNFLPGELSVQVHQNFFNNSKQLWGQWPTELMTPKSAAYAQEKGHTSDAANLDKGRREPGIGLAPDNEKAARGDRGTGSDASAALAAPGGGPGLQSCSVTG